MLKAFARLIVGTLCVAGAAHATTYEYASGPMRFEDYGSPYVGSTGSITISFTPITDVADGRVSLYDYDRDNIGSFSASFTTNTGQIIYATSISTIFGGFVDFQDGQIVDYLIEAGIHEYEHYGDPTSEPPVFNYYHQIWIIANTTSSHFSYIWEDRHPDGSYTWAQYGGWGVSPGTWVAVVPEPSAYALSSAALAAGIAMIRRHRRLQWFSARNHSQRPEMA